jgi:eukaryotic-like serine/threonine-protein kinase
VTAYPNKDDYLRAVQHPESFTSEDLRRARFVVHPVWQIPTPAAGRSAVVFKALVGGREQALRFLTRPDAARRDRYEALRDHFVGHGLVDCVALASWQDDAIWVNGRTWPVVRMEWVNGRTLNQHVDQLVEWSDTGALAELAATWRALVDRLQRARFAHGDLQHGNVLVDEHGAPRLVDFDCAWLERFTGQPPPPETGHRNYQPATRPWGRWMDTFSSLVVYLSLLALSKNPAPWRVLHTGENLLLRRDDFRPPFQTPAWLHLSSIRDPEVDEVAARLRECCAPGWTASGGLTDLLAARTRPWWELTAQTAAQPRMPATARSAADRSAADRSAADRSGADRSGADQAAIGRTGIGMALVGGLGIGVLAAAAAVLISVPGGAGLVLILLVIGGALLVGAFRL